MKINQKKTEFEPITITLESMKEVNQFWAICDTYPALLDECRKTVSADQIEAVELLNDISGAFSVLDLKHDQRENALDELTRPSRREGMGYDVDGE